MPASRQPALMRTIHSERNSRFLFLRPTYAYLRAFSTASCAARFSLLLVRKKPFARSNVLRRESLRLVPRLTLGTFQLLIDGYRDGYRLRWIGHVPRAPSTRGWLP